MRHDARIPLAVGAAAHDICGNRWRHFFMRAAAAGIACACSGTAAQPAVTGSGQNYPMKPMHFIVPAPPAGGADIVARAIGQRLTASWGQPVVIDNRAGATGSIGALAVARAAPDGYTLMVSTSAVLTILPHLYPKLGFDPRLDFAPVTLASSAPYVLVVHPQLAATTVKELIALAKSRPSQLNFSSSGNGSTTHLAGVLFNNLAAVDMVHVPYKGAAPAITDLLAGQIQLRFSAILPVLPHIRNGRLRPLAVTGATRSSLLAGLPTVGETLPGYEVDSWYGVLAPAGTPAALVAKLNAEIVRQLHTAEVKARLAADGSEPVGNSPAEFAAIIRADLQRWGQAVRDSGVRVD